MLLYLIGSLRDTRIPNLASDLRDAGHDVIDDWYAAGPEADDIWQRYEESRGHTLPEGLRGIHAQAVFRSDRDQLNRADGGVLVLPSGKSGHLELGYLIGQGKPGYVLMPNPPERWDVMYAFATAVVTTWSDLVKVLERG